MAKKKTKIADKILKYLEKSGVKHEILEHRTAYTAIDAANTMKRKLGEIAKSLLVKADKNYYLILLPADHNLDFEKLKKHISKIEKKDIKSIKIPTEKIIETVLKIKAGSISAFGSLSKLSVLADKKMEKIKKGIFSSGSANHSIEMAVKDFVKLENAFLGSFSVKKKIGKIKKQESKEARKQKNKKTRKQESNPKGVPLGKSKKKVRSKKK